MIPSIYTIILKTFYRIIKPKFKYFIMAYSSIINDEKIIIFSYALRPGI